MQDEYKIRMHTIRVSLKDIVRKILHSFPHMQICAMLCTATRPSYKCTWYYGNTPEIIKLLFSYMLTVRAFSDTASTSSVSIERQNCYKKFLIWTETIYKDFIVFAVMAKGIIFWLLRGIFPRFIIILNGHVIKVIKSK